MRHPPFSTFATGLSVTADRGDDGMTTTLPGGRVIARRDTPDARFGQLSPLSILTETLPVTGTRTTTMARSVTLGSPTDPFSITMLSDTLTQNGITSNRVYDGATRTWTATSAEDARARWCSTPTAAPSSRPSAL